MNNETFWISDDGVITTAKEKKESNLLELTITFRLKDKAEIEIAPQPTEKDPIQRTELAWRVSV